MSYQDTILVGQNQILGGHHQKTLYQVDQSTYYTNVKENCIIQVNVFLRF